MAIKTVNSGHNTKAMNLTYAMLAEGTSVTTDKILECRRLQHEDCFG